MQMMNTFSEMTVCVTEGTSQSSKDTFAMYLKNLAI